MKTRAPSARSNLPWIGFAVLLAGVGLGRFGYPPLIPAIVRDGWFTVSQADYLAAANLAGYLLGAAIANRLASRYSALFLLRLSMIVEAASFLACVAPFTFWWFAFWRLAAGTAAGILMVLAVPAILSHTPADRRSVAGGIIFSGVGCGIALAGTLIPLVLRRSLPATWAVIGAAAALLALIVWRKLPGEIEALAPSHVSFDTPLVLLMVAYAATAIGFAPHTLFWVDYIARGLGLGIAAGSRYWIVLGFGALVGPMVAGRIARRLGVWRSLCGTVLLQAASLAIVAVSSSSVVLALSSVGCGSMIMGTTALGSARVAELRPASQRVVWGWMTLTFSASYAAGAYLFTFLFARTGSYHLPFLLASAGLLVAFVLQVMGGNRR